MLFSSIPFLYYFLPVVLAAYFLVPARLRNGMDGSEVILETSVSGN